MDLVTLVQNPSLAIKKASNTSAGNPVKGFFLIESTDPQVPAARRKKHKYLARNTGNGQESKRNTDSQEKLRRNHLDSGLKQWLVTQDKVRRWGSIDMMVCPLCKKDMDSHQHLFFQCEYFAEVWERIKVKAGIQTDKTGWNDLVDDMSKLYCGNSIDSIIRRLSLAACVYLIWQERNWRIFRDEKRKPEELFSIFEDLIRMRLMSLKVKQSRVFGWQFYKEMLFYNKQVLKSLVQNATMRNGMLGGLPAMVGGHLSDTFSVGLNWWATVEGNVAKRDCFPEQLLSKCTC
ncbi:reverse transcriptase zinc-binding domain-containing protein [Tanacetum coccineum]